MKREVFFSNVASAILRSQLPQADRPKPTLPKLDPVDLVELFRTRAQSVNAVVHGPVSRHSAPRAVVGIAAGHGVSSFASWAHLPAPGVPSALSSQGWNRIAIDGNHDDLEKMSSADMGITGADFGLAESGSVVLTHGPGRGRLVSLLPEVHVALLNADAIHRTLFGWAADGAGSPEETANLVIVSGPSRTGDIELELNLGVHGPKHVHVVLIR